MSLDGCARLFIVCVCVCEGCSTAGGGGLRPEMGQFLLSSLNYLVRRGVSGSTPSLTMEQSSLFFCFVLVFWGVFDEHV